MPTTISVDLTAVVTVVGVVFAVAVAVATAVIGNRTLGSYNLRIRKYELLFEQKCAAFLRYIEFVSRIWATDDAMLSFSPEFEAIDRQARLFAKKETRSEMVKLNSALVIWAEGRFETSRAPDVNGLFSAVTELMQEELAEEAGSCRRKKK